MSLTKVTHELLDGIEAGATADQTAEEIRTLGAVMDDEVTNLS